MNYKHLYTALLLTVIFLSSCSQNKSADNWEKLFTANKVTGTFVLKKLNSDEVLTYNKTRSNQQFVPASTFKILNSLIALQELAVQSIDDTIKWDGVKRTNEHWNKDQTIRTAFPISCVWFYQEMARRTGHQKMQTWLNASNYGNKLIKNKIDWFWLDGELAISANEQIYFLEKLIKDELPFDKNIQKIVKNVMISDSTAHYTIHSKTGWSKNIGWNVGYIVTKDNTWIFAMNINMNNMEMANSRIKLTYEILKEQEIIK